MKMNRNAVLAAAALLLAAVPSRAEDSFARQLQRAEELVVDPMTGHAYRREDLVAPRPKPAEFTVDAQGRKHYHYDTPREEALKAICSRIRSEGAITSSRNELERVIRLMFADGSI